VYRKLKELAGNAPVRLIATILFAVLIPSILMTALGLFAVYQADVIVKEHTTGAYRRELEELTRLLDEDWSWWLRRLEIELADAGERRQHLPELRNDPRIQDVLISDAGGLQLLPSHSPPGELEVGAAEGELDRARRLEFRDRDFKAAHEEYRQLLWQSHDDAVVLVALEGAARMSHRLGRRKEAAGFLDEAWRRFGETRDATGVRRSLPLLCRKLEIEREDGAVEAEETAARLASALKRESAFLSPDAERFYREKLAALQPASAKSAAAAPAAPALGADAIPLLEETLLRAAQKLRSSPEPIISQARFHGGEELTFASLRAQGGELAIHLLLDTRRFLAEAQELAAGFTEPAEKLRFGRAGGSLLEGEAPPQSGERVIAVQALPAPFEHVELRYLLLPGSLPGFRSLEVMTLASFSWAIIVLVLAIVAGVFLTLRSVLREMETARLKSDFVSFISHELKTPIAAIRMFAETLLAGRVDSEEEKRVCLQLIDRESERLTTLIDKVIEYSRIERHQKVFQFASCSMEDVVEEAVRLFHEHNKERPRQVEINTVQRISKINMDRASMVELILNLLSNAAKYSAAGERILVNLRESMDEISVEVVDRGIGIPKRDQKRIFEKFFRSQDYLTREIEGTGLGLAFARYIARVHKGDIKVSSQVNCGSTFTLQLKKTHVLAE
jgi:signal transduction histidine kinase